MPDILQIIKNGSYDFVDFGCSRGGSIEWAMKKFSGRKGLGIDIDPAKVELTVQAGFDAIVADATKTPTESGLVRFCTMLHFLEHLKTKAEVRTCLGTAVMLSREFVYLRQPWFEGAAELLRLGYKLYWADWSGHPNALSTLDLVTIIQRMPRARRFVIFGRTPVKSIRDVTLVPVTAPVNSRKAAEAEVAQRPNKSIPIQVFHELGCVIQVGTDEQFEPVLISLKADHIFLYDSHGAADGRPT